MSLRERRQERLMATAQKNNNHAGTVADGGPEEFWNDTIALIRESLKPDLEALHETQLEVREIREEMTRRFDAIDAALENLLSK